MMIPVYELNKLVKHTSFAILHHIILLLFSFRCKFLCNNLSKSGETVKKRRSFSQIIYEHTIRTATLNQFDPPPPPASYQRRIVGVWHKSHSFLFANQIGSNCRESAICGRQTGCQGIALELLE